jgi:penicillin-binding protein 2
MINSFFRKFKKRVSSKNRAREIDPDEILIDAENLPAFNVYQFEGRMEKPITLRAVAFLAAIIFLIIGSLSYRAYALDIRDGATYATESNTNSLTDTTIFADRGAIFDRNGVRLAWNTIDPNERNFSARSYATSSGLGLLLGYVKYPAQDKNGNYYRKDFQGVDGIEASENADLSGKNGSKVTEVDVTGKVISESVVQPAQDGADVTLSIDSRIQSELYDAMQGLATRVGFTGGAAAIMNVKTGEIVAMTSYPEYDSSVMTDGSDTSLIQQYLKDTNLPFLNRVTSGLYTPGSIVKPYIALAAQKEDVIDPNRLISTTGSISVPNAYDPAHPSVFRDWQNQGLVDMRKAIAMSSDVYFYEVGGGYGDIAGLGIQKLDQYFNDVGFGSWVGQGIFKGPAGTVPSVAWKATNFPNDPWRIGDTYHTSIGQYGFQVTPIQILRAVAAIANDGKLFEPTIIKVGSSTPTALYSDLPFTPAEYQVVHEGMRDGVTQGGTSQGLNVPYVAAAGKTGTAQLGSQNQYVNSWSTGFFPYNDPTYAWVVLMEHGPATNDLGGIYVMRTLFDWMNAHTPEYFKS